MKAGMTPGCFDQPKRISLPCFHVATYRPAWRAGARSMQRLPAVRFCASARCGSQWIRSVFPGLEGFRRVAPVRVARGASNNLLTAGARAAVCALAPAMGVPSYACGSGFAVLFALALGASARAGEVVDTIVVDHVRFTREGLHRLFVKHVGRSVTSEIRRKRIAHAQDLLQRTDKKIHEIAELSGFSSAVKMHKVFKRELGRTPGAYRTRTTGAPGR